MSVSTTTHLIVMAKAPAPGLAKTRLIPALGATGAAALAARLLEHTMAMAMTSGLTSVTLAVTPDRDHPAFLRLASGHPGLQIVLQSSGDLGQRMQTAMQPGLATHDKVLLIGTDAPALDAKALLSAAAALDAADAVFVPALDGGYALVGLVHPQPALFDGMRWSTPHVMEDTRIRARAAGLRWTELAPVADIDEPGDLRHLPVDWGFAHGRCEGPGEHVPPQHGAAE